MATSNRFAAAREAAAKEHPSRHRQNRVVTPSRAEAPSPSKPRKGGEEGQKPSTGKRRAPAARATPKKADAGEVSQASSRESGEQSYTTYGFMITEDQNKALNRLKGIDGLNRSLVIREALDAWIAAHKDEYPESLGQYGK